MEHSTLSKKAEKYIIDNILKGKYKPGDRIVEMKIANDLNMSQAPIREAICNLKSTGFIKNEPYKGSKIKKFNSEDIRQIYSVRLIMEKYAIKEAIKNIKREELARLNSIVEKMYKAVEEEDYLRQLELDRDFHSYIIKITGNKVLIKVWYSIGIGYWIYNAYEAIHKEVVNWKIEAEKHEEIYKALKHKKGEKCIELIKDHYCNYLSED